MVGTCGQDIASLGCMEGEYEQLQVEMRSLMRKLKVSVKSKGMAISLEAVHDACLLVVSNPFLKEVGLTPVDKLK